MAKKKSKQQRSKGEGCITQRQDGTWAAVVTVGRNENGKLKRRFIYGKTRQDVAEKLNKILMELQLGDYIDPSKTTFSEWLDFWFSEYIVNNIKLSTKISYDTYINKHIKPKIGHISLQQLRTDMLQMFYNEKNKNGRLDKKGGLSAKTIRNIHNMIHEALEQAYNTGLIHKNPSNAVVLPKRIKKEIRVLTPQEQQQLLTAARKERLGIGIVLDLFTGLRLGELLGLQWKHIDFTNGILHVKQTLNRLKSYDENCKTRIVIGDPKTLCSKRKIPLHEIMIEELKEYKKNQEEIKSLAGDLYNDEGFIFSNNFGKPIEPRTYQDFFYKIIRLAGIEKANFHCLRHSFATRALEMGIPAKTVSELLGHSSITITLDLYSHVLMDLKKDTIDKLSILFKNDNPYKEIDDVKNIFQNEMTNLKSKTDEVDDNLRKDPSDDYS